jgi:Mg-chelatase subunit ChlI-like protein
VIWLMFVCRARSLSLFGIDALPVEVEVDVSSGLPGFSIVGLPDAAVQEARERVRVAISNSGYKFPTKKVIVNLAPANLRKEGLLLPAVLKDSSLRADLFSVLLMVLYLRFRGVRGVLRCALIHKLDAAAHEGRSRPGALLSAYSDVASTLRILQSTNGSELRFRALLSRGCAGRLEVARA